MSVGENEIIEVTNVVWESMLGIELAPCGDDVPEPVPGPFLTGCVLINGAFEGGVTIQMPLPTARYLAGLMFGMETDDVSDEETTDAIGELANMVGGNLKALVAQPSKISLPSVTEGTDYRVTIPGTAVAHRCTFVCEGMPVLVSLHAPGGAASHVEDPMNDMNARSVA